MKWLIILVLLALLVIIIATRYRPQIQTALYVWKMFRKMRQMDKPDEKQIEQPNSTDVPLIRCAKCGTWMEQKNALNLRSKTFYCSTNCMEKAVVK